MALNVPLLGSAKVAANIAGIPAEVLTRDDIKGSGSKDDTNNEKGSSNSLTTIAVSILAAISRECS